MGLTPAQVKTQVRAMSGESGTAFLTDAILYSFIWQGEIELAEFAGCALDVDTSITTTATTREYDTPDRTIRILRLLYDSVKLKKIDLTELDMLEGSAYGGVTTSGNPQFYYQFAGVIGLSPIPDASKTLTIYRVIEPAEIDSSSTVFTIYSEYSKYLIDYALYRFYAMDGNIQQANFHLELWEKHKVKAKNDFYKKKFIDRFLTVKNEDIFQQTNYGII